MTNISATKAFLDTITNEFNYELTQTWWEKLLQNEEAMNKWLAKLWKTEHGGYADNNNAITNYNLEGKNRSIFKQTGEDELKHAQLLEDVLVGRQVKTTLEEQPGSIYWDYMYQYINDAGSCAAVFAVGEQLAALRFKIIAEHKGTPSDVMYFLNEALPDETYHAKAFASIATSEEMKIAYDNHNIAVGMLIK